MTCHVINPTWFPRLGNPTVLKQLFLVFIRMVLPLTLPEATSGKAANETADDMPATARVSLLAFLFREDALCPMRWRQAI